MTNKRFGRIGDSPIIGVGTYADNNACGISATGHGEYFIRAAVAHICARVKYQGVSLRTAANAVVHTTLVKMGGDGGVIGLDPSGEVVYAFNTTGTYRGSIDTSGELGCASFSSPIPGKLQTAYSCSTRRAGPTNDRKNRKG